MTSCIAACLLAAAAAPAPETPTARVHSITDIAHEFTFYFDGRFGANYVTPAGGADARNWAALRHADFARANLIVLQAGASMCPFPKEDVDAVRAFLAEGGGVAILGEHALFKGEKEYRLNEIAREFGAEFVATRAEEPLAAAPELGADAVRTYGGATIALAKPADWKVLIADARGRPVMARRAVGKGSVLVCSRALVGRNPDAKDPINDGWWQPLLRDLAAGKAVDPAHPPRDTMPEIIVEKEGLKIQYSEYLAPYADATFAIYTRVRPVMERLLGVPPAKGMMGSLILLPTGGGGFSSGATVGLGIWWGGFPEKTYGMMELLGHEATHSWVLPFAEPLWNEGIATYVGILVGRELGEAAEAGAALKNWLDACTRHDPDMTKYDLAARRGVPHEVAMAKPMWIWEQLRKEKPDILARYFQLKRKLVDPAKRARYTADDSVEVLSRAMGRDLFPWFVSLGISVDKSRVEDL